MVADTDLELITSVCVEGTIVVQDVDEFEVVSYTNFVIVRVVCGSNLHGASTKFHINDDRVGDDRNAAVKEGVLGKLSMQMLIPGIVRVHGNGGIAQHGFGTGGGDDDLLIYNSAISNSLSSLK